MKMQGDQCPIEPAQHNPFGLLLRALRERMKLTPGVAASKLRRQLRERLVQSVTPAKLRDWEAGYGLPEPVVLEVYLEALEAPEKSLENVEAALRSTSAVETAMIGSRAPRGLLSGALESPEQSKRSWRRAKVRLAAEELLWAAAARSLSYAARRKAARAAVEPGRTSAQSRSREESLGESR
jgi:hypothetical protein